jgi:uncharacterized membrane protein
VTRLTVLELASDVLILVAVASIGYGCWLVSPALAFVVVGLLLIVLAVALQGHVAKKGRAPDVRE